MNDRLFLQKFLGVGVVNSNANVTTGAFFRERLHKSGVIEKPFEMFEAYLRSQGRQARGAQIIDATLLPVH